MLLAGWLLQGTAFSMTERDRLGVRGLLPPNVVSSQQQIDRFSTSPPFRSAV
jgi:malate dehydrogenase (decarboxylating)